MHAANYAGPKILARVSARLRDVARAKEKRTARPHENAPQALRDLSDRDLVERWRSGSTTAGATLFERHTPGLGRYFKARRAHAPEDLTQRTCLICTQRLHTLLDPSKFRAFLFGIARNVLFESMRHTRETTTEELEQDPAAPDRTASQVTALGEQRSALALALAHLSPEHEMAVILHYWRGLSVAEIAEVQGVAPGTVKSRLARSRDQLRRYAKLRKISS